MDVPTCRADAVRRIVGIGERAGLERAELLRAARLDARTLRDGEARIAVDHLYALWRWVGARRAAVCAEAAATMRIEELGPYGFLLQTAGSGREALAAAVRYYSLINDGGAWRVSGERAVRVVWERRTLPSLGAARSDEAVVASFIEGIRRVTPGPLAISSVSFAHPAPAEPRRLRELLRAPIEWDARHTGFELDARALEGPPPQSSAAMHAYFEEHVRREWSALRGSASLSSWVRAQLARRLAEGVHASELAAALGITERTLRRRLLAEGTSLSAIADALRRERALVLLRESDLSISAIAHQLGFADATAFSRAFRRYAGTSPERARRSLDRH